METQFFEPKNTIWGSFTQPICGDVGCLANHLEKNAAYCFWWYLIQTEDWRHKMQPRKKLGSSNVTWKPPLFSTYFHWWSTAAPWFRSGRSSSSTRSSTTAVGHWAWKTNIHCLVAEPPREKYHKWCCWLTIIVPKKIRRTWIRYWYWYCNVVAMTMIMTIIVIIYQYWQITITIVNNI